MKIVLLDDVINVGEAGEIVEVKNGYARNFLIPRQLAEGLPPVADRLNEISFGPVTTESIRLEATLDRGAGAGILEWSLR